MPTPSSHSDSLATRIGDALKFRSFCSLSWLAGHLPLRLSYWIGARIGDFIYLFWTEHSGNAVSNMLRVLGPDTPPAAIRHATRKAFHNYVQVLIDFLRMPYVSLNRLEREIEGIGWEHLEAARQAGKGAIIAACHAGSWDFGGALLGRYGLPLTAVADPMKPQRLDDFVSGQRARMGIKTVPANDPGALRRLFTVLRQNEFVALHVDRPVPGEGVEVRFFGEPAWVPSGPAAIALKTGAAIIPGFLLRNPGRGPRFRGQFAPAIDYQPLLTGDKEHDIQAIAQAIMTFMEGVIRDNPTQWYMFRRMWPRIDLRERRMTRVGRRLDAFRRWRTGRARRRTAVEGLGLGISVDPPVIEEWVGAQNPAPAPAPPPAPRPLEQTATEHPATAKP